MRVAINLLTEDPENPSGAHWFWTRVIPEMAKRLEFGEELHLLVSPKSRHLHQGYGPNVFYITYPWSNERRTLRTLTEHLYSPLRLPVSRIDVFNTLMAPLVNISWSLVIHMKTMHAFTAPEAIGPLPRAYRRMNYPRSARVAKAIIINSESLRSEIEQYLNVDPRKLKLIYEAVDHDLFKPGDAGAARAIVASHGVTKPFVLFVSSLWPYKNCDGLLRAWALARRELGDRQLAIVGPGRDEKYVARLHSLAAELGISDDVVFVGGVPLEETVRFYQAADVFVYPSFNETFGLPILEAMACGCPVVTSDTSAMPEIAGGAACLVRSQRSGVHRPGHRRGGRAGPPARRRAPAGRPVHLGGDGRVDPRRLPRGRRAPAPATEMRVLVTGGAGFIGSHTCDRLLALGHDVVVLDALTPPVHRNGQPAYLNPEGRLLPGRHPQPRPAHEPSAPRRRRLPPRRLPGLPARLLAILRRERGLDGPALRDHRRRAPRPRPRRGGVVAGGDGRRALPVPDATASRYRGCAPRGARRGPVGHPLPGVRWPARDAGHARADLESAERLRHVEARPGDGRHQPRPPVRHPDRRPPLQHRPGPAAVGLQRVLGCMPHLLPELPAGHSADPLRGRRGDPRLRQHRRRRGRQHAACWRTTAPLGGSSTSAAASRSRPGNSPTSSCASTVPTSRAW